MTYSSGFVHRVSMFTAREILKHLIAIPSISPEDKGCQEWIRDYLRSFGFQIEDLSHNKTTNTWAWCGARQDVKVIFAGHTDVVPVIESQWQSDPFILTELNNRLYGRGSCDMKGSLAALLAAVPKICQKTVPFGIILTSDEEGDAVDGTRYVTNQLIRQGIQPDVIVVGEPSSLTELGDSIRVGRRGSIHFNGVVSGKSGHTAYPEKHINPIDLLCRCADQYKRILHSCHPTSHGLYPASHISFTSFKADYISNNVTPSSAPFSWNLRFSPFFDIEGFTLQVNEVHANLGITGQWTEPSPSYDGKKNIYTDILSTTIKDILNVVPDLNAGGGTSDGRFLQQFDCEIMEFGPVNASIHQSNESIGKEELDQLTDIYSIALSKMLFKNIHVTNHAL